MRVCPCCGCAETPLPEDLEDLGLPDHMNRVLRHLLIRGDRVYASDLDLGRETMSVYVGVIRRALLDVGVERRIHGDSRTGYKLHEGAKAPRIARRRGR